MAVVDQTIVDLSGLGLREIAVTLGRSRQAVDRGVKNDNKPYFRVDDLRNIYTSVCTLRPERKEQLAELIRNKYAEIANLIVVAAGKGTLDSALSAAASAWVFVHDFEQFRIDLPDPFRVLQKLILKPNIKVSFITTTLPSCLDIDVYGRKLLGEVWDQRRAPNNIFVGHSRVTKYMPMMIMLDPDTEPKAFVTTFQAFEPLGEFQARRLALSLDAVAQGAVAHAMVQKNVYANKVRAPYDALDDDEAQNNDKNALQKKPD